MRLEFRAPRELTAWHDNPPSRERDTTLYRRLKESLRVYGILAPLIACQREEQVIVLDGNRRLRAASELGFDLVPVVIHDDMPHSLLATIAQANLNTSPWGLRTALEVAQSVGIDEVYDVLPATMQKSVMAMRRWLTDSEIVRLSREHSPYAHQWARRAALYCSMGEKGTGAVLKWILSQPTGAAKQIRVLVETGFDPAVLRKAIKSGHPIAQAM